MEDLLKKKEEFERVVNKYNLNDKDKAMEISKYLVITKEINLGEFSNLFAIDIDDARIFLSFIETGLKFKEEHLDKK